MGGGGKQAEEKSKDRYLEYTVTVLHILFISERTEIY